jgi:hypothetical protein
MSDPLCASKLELEEAEMRKLVSDFISENLRVQIDTRAEYGCDCIVVRLILEDVEISSSSISVKQDVVG